MHNFNRLSLMTVLMAAALDTDAAGATGGAAPAVAPVAPAGFAYVEETFHFRKFADTEANRTGEKSKLPAAATTDHEIVVKTEVVDGTPMFQRTPEVHALLVPTPELFGLAATVDTEVDGKTVPVPNKDYTVLANTLTNFMKAAARALVDQGKTPTQDNCSWDVVRNAEYTRLTTGGGADASSGISVALLKDFSSKFAVYMKSIGKPDTGTEATVKMINSRFGRMATMNYIAVMDKITDNIGLFFTEGLSEAEQEGYAALLEYLLAKAEEAVKPVEAPDVDAMFG